MRSLRKAILVLAILISSGASGAAQDVTVTEAWARAPIGPGLPTIGSEAGGVAFWAHAGGFLAGVALIHLFKSRRLIQEHGHATARQLPRARFP